MKIRCLLAIAMLACVLATPSAQLQMPDPKQIAGVPLPANDVPAGTVSVRVIRGSFAKNIQDATVEFSIDGKVRREKTDASGRAQVAGLARGAKVRASAVIDGAKLESQEIVVGETGVRVVLVAVDPELEERAEEDRRLAASPPVRGMVVFGPETRMIVEMSKDQLNVFYVLQILNTARTPVDPGGPVIFDLPRDARGVSLLQESSKQASAKGHRLIVTGPFAPGPTMVHVAFEQPYNRDTARIEQTWPASLQSLNVLVLQIGGLDVRSPQISTKREVTDQGQKLIVAGGPSIPAGQSLVLEITGLPHHAIWPRYAALSLAAVIVCAGIWAAVAPTPRRRAA
ncbi:MAG TPA: hypothetical protein VES67_14125 [Vicinamibacterales bacterium]|nr:hypothetical protein [Vicinamibacterales bacterium]